ncbi:MAG: hypothetical protein MUE33_05710 [Cytophagaceae bacterium]|nr:hypothetical protein [Cytophagaceae bacterium]
MKLYSSFFLLCFISCTSLWAQQPQVSVANRPMPKAIQGLEVSAKGKILFTKQGYTYLLNEQMDTLSKVIGVKAKFIGTTDAYSVLISLGNSSLIYVYGEALKKIDSIQADIPILDYIFHPSGKHLYAFTKSSQFLSLDMNHRTLTVASTSIPPANITGIGYMETNRLLVGANILGAIIDTSGTTVSYYQTPNISVIRTLPTVQQYAILHLAGDYSFISWKNGAKEITCKHSYAQVYPYYQILMGKPDTIRTMSAMFQSFDIRSDGQQLLSTDQSGRLLLWNSQGQVSKEIVISSKNTIARFYSTTKLLYYNTVTQRLEWLQY